MTTETIHEQVRVHYAERGTPSDCRRLLFRRAGDHRRPAVQHARAGRAARRGRAREPWLREPDRCRRAPRGRARPRPRLRRRHRRSSLREAGRTDRSGDRSRHDGRDAGACAKQRCRGRSDQRRVPERPHRGDPVAGGLRRRRHLELRDQPGRGQTGGLPRDRARLEAWWADGRDRHRRRGSPRAEDRASPARTPAASRAPCHFQSSRRA